MKYPFLVSFPNSFEITTGERRDLFVSLWTLEEMEKRFGHLKRPVSSEELGAVVKSLVTRGMNLLKSWRR